jgi:squalene-associated FAD-dependent desaturase
VTQQLHNSVAVVGGGIAGMSAACALAEAGFHVTLIERRGYLGGRASSYLHPGVNEVVDNCQHVLFGCCTNLPAFYRRIGVESRIHWTSEMTMIEPGGRRSVLGPSPIPAPLHGFPRLLAARAFSFADKFALARAFSAAMRGDNGRPGENLAQWLARHGQTRGALDRFWRMVIASALNAEIETIAVPYATKVIRELFMNSAWAGAMGMSTVPLSQLYAAVPGFLTARGGKLILNSNVESAAWNADAGQWQLSVRGLDEPFLAGALVLALPFEGLQKLLPAMPASPGKEKLTALLTQHVHWPICSVHLWFDREITDLDHAVLLDRQIHWMYNQSKLQSRPGHYIELVVSATRAFAALDRNAAIEQALRELAEFFPRVREARLEKVALIKEVRATFGVPPGIDAARPGVESPWPRCFLAGDWIATGWPSTMESAARSGHLAADALCESLGQPPRHLVPDLKPTGLMRWF